MTGSFRVVAVPGPVAEGEAEHAAQFSVASLGQTEAPHAAHVVLAYTAGGRPVGARRAAGVHARRRRAARRPLARRPCTGATPAPRIPRGFFVDIARNVEIPVPLWSGVSQSRLADGAHQPAEPRHVPARTPRPVARQPVPKTPRRRSAFFRPARVRGGSAASCRSPARRRGAQPRSCWSSTTQPSPIDDELTVFRVDLP